MADHPPSPPRAAFEAVYRETFDTVTRYVARRVHNPADVADIVASTYVEALACWDGYDARRGRPIGWIIGIAHNQVAMDARRRRYRAQLEPRIAGRELLAPDEYGAIEELIDAARLAPRVERAIAAVCSGPEAELLRLVRQDGLTVADAARALGVAPVTARMRLSRARRRVRLHMASREATDHPITGVLPEGSPE